MKKTLTIISMIWFCSNVSFCQTISSGSWEMINTINKKYGTENCLTISVKWNLKVNGRYTRTHKGPSSNSDYKGKYTIDYENRTINFFESRLLRNGRWIDVLNNTYSIIFFNDKELIVNECYCNKSESDSSSDERCITKYIKI